MGGRATFTMDFGTGANQKDDIVVTVPGLSGIAADSDVEAWIIATQETSDNPSDAHVIASEYVQCTPQSINAGAGSCDVRCTAWDAAMGLTGTFYGRLGWY